MSDHTDVAVDLCQERAAAKEQIAGLERYKQKTADLLHAVYVLTHATRAFAGKTAFFWMNEKSYSGNLKVSLMPEVYTDVLRNLTLHIHQEDLPRHYCMLLPQHVIDTVELDLQWRQAQRRLTGILGVSYQCENQRKTCLP